MLPKLSEPGNASARRHGLVTLHERVAHQPSSSRSRKIALPDRNPFAFLQWPDRGELTRDTYRASERPT
jgi:hypothetical protein